MRQLLDFKQKKRNKFFKITPIAIKNVRCVHFDGFSQEQLKFIQEQHKRLLTIAMVENDSKEVGILIDIHSWETWVIHGSVNCVDIRDNKSANERLTEGRKNTLLFMHNHPSTGTFSEEDFKTFCLNDSLYIITAIGNDGSIKSLTKLERFDANNAFLEYYSILNDKARVKKAMTVLLKRCSCIELKYENGGGKYDR